jgi:hypothetical protein
MSTACRMCARACVMSQASRYMADCQCSGQPSVAVTIAQVAMWLRSTTARTYQHKRLFRQQVICTGTITRRYACRHAKTLTHLQTLLYLTQINIQLSERRPPWVAGKTVPTGIEQVILLVITVSRCACAAIIVVGRKSRQTQRLYSK